MRRLLSLLLAGPPPVPGPGHAADGLDGRWRWPPRQCPACGAERGGRDGLHWHRLTAWCLGCGWAQNRHADRGA